MGKTQGLENPQSPQTRKNEDIRGEEARKGRET
jgi:hypothetical protein